MKILNNKGLTQKIIITIVIVLTFNFMTPTYSSAANNHGGVLFGPVIDLIAGIGDSVMALLQFFMDGGSGVEISSEGFLKKVTDFDAATYGMQTESGLESVTIDAEELDKGWFGSGTYSIPIIKYSPEKIFSNEIPALDANFINPKTEGYSAEQQEKSIAIQLQETISSWYNALRNLVIVLLLSILLYVGIRMMLTSISSDKAKYKQMLIDWIVALCLLFFLHYIMSFTMTFVGIITDGLQGATDINITVQDSENGNVSFKTNLTGYCRMQVQYKDLGERMVYLIFYIALVVYTFMFTWKYMKRAITMAFLTLMAPLVTLTYPIDKMGDGKAQAFNMWLKEYIFNALLQPFHLIIYTVFLGASMSIAINNPLYAILFLAFITPAEKILRKFFKFDQASTAGATSFAGGFGGAAAFNAVKGLISKGTKGNVQSKGGAGKVGDGNIRQQRQLTDPNSPDGRLDPFLVGAPAESNNNNNTEPVRPTENRRKTEPQQISEGERIRREQQAINDLRNDAKDEQDQIYLDQQQKDLRESDQRGVLEWGRDVAKERWDNSSLKENLNTAKANIANSKPIRFTRQVGEGAKAKLGEASDSIKEKYNAMPKPIRNSLERTGQAGKRAIKGAARVVKKAAPQALKMGGKVVAAGTIGAVGLGMGIAGDELEDVFKYGSAGATLGYTAGPALAGSIASGVSSVGSEIRTSYEEGAYGTEEAALREQDRQFTNNQNNRDFFEEKLTEQNGSKPTRGELNDTMEVAAEYNRAGISDLKQINKTMLLEKELQKELQSSTSMTESDVTRSARNQAMTIAKIANGVDAKDLRDKNKVQQLQDSFARELKSKDSNMSDKAAEAQASRIVAMVKKQKKVY